MIIVVMKMNDSRIKDVTWDVGKTENFYQKMNESCDCAYCRNFNLTIDRFYPALSDFLVQFGLTMNRPVESVQIYRDYDGIVHYESWYGVIRNSQRRILPRFIRKIESLFCVSK